MNPFMKRDVSVTEFTKLLYNCRTEYEYELSGSKVIDGFGTYKIVKGGWVWCTIFLDNDKGYVTYQNWWEHDGQKLTVSDDCDVWQTDGFGLNVVDEEGFDLDKYDIGEIILEHIPIDLEGYINEVRGIEE